MTEYLRLAGRRVMAVPGDCHGRVWGAWEAYVRRKLVRVFGAFFAFSRHSLRA